MNEQLSYSVVTPARNDAANLERLAASMASQTVAPNEWVVVENGSTDETATVAARIAGEIPFARLLVAPTPDSSAIRGRPIVDAFHAGLAVLLPADVVVKLDADVSFKPDFFECLLAEFDADPRLGIAGGVCCEQDAAGEWHPTFTTRDHVRGATRAYRSECLALVTPLEPRMGWDGIDELRAQVAGWRTRTIAELPFHHHRPLGGREQTWRKWVAQGDMAHFMGYRFGYLLARIGYRVLREPAAVGMAWGFISAAIRHAPRYPDPSVRRHLRSQQSFRSLPRRIREALGRTDGVPSATKRADLP